jgi:hypothetical protein
MDNNTIVEEIPRDINGKPLRSKFLICEPDPAQPPEGVDLIEAFNTINAKRTGYFENPDDIGPIEYTLDETRALRYWCENGQFYSLSHLGLSRYMISYDARLLNLTINHITKGSCFSGRQRFSVADDTGKTFQIMANVLMAKAFLPPPPSPEHDTVDHMDMDETNDYFYNLRWATRRQQALNRKRPAMPRRGKPVLQLDIGTRGIIKVWSNLTEATKGMNLSSLSYIGNAIKFNRVSTGYRWAYDYTSLVDEFGKPEEWRKVECGNYNNVWASHMGRIYTDYSGCWYGHTNVYDRKVVRVPTISGDTQAEYVHTLIALAFIGLPPEDKPTVDHFDGNSLNNRADNLRYLSGGDNTRHAFAIGKNRGNINSSLSKPVVQLTMDDKFINEFESAQEASRQTKIDAASIRNVSAGKVNRAGGYKWIKSADYFK